MDLLPLSETVSTSLQLNEWLFETIKPYLQGRVLEVNSSLNTISAVFVEKGRRIHLSTADKVLGEKLRAHYQGVKVVRKVHSINFHRPDFALAYSLEKAAIFDTILILNPMQDGEFNVNVAKNARNLLKESGHLILLAPTFTTSYGGFGLDLNELKRCNHPAVKRIVTKEMAILATQYFDLPADSPYDRAGLSVIIVARKINFF